MPDAVRFLILTAAGWVNRHQEDVIDYLREENRVLREQLGPRPLRLTDAQRRRLAVRGQKLGRRILAQVAGIVTPDTILRTITRETIRAATTNSCSDRHLRSTRTPTLSGGSASADFSASTTERPHEGAADYLHLTGYGGRTTRLAVSVVAGRVCVYRGTRFSPTRVHLPPKSVFKIGRNTQHTRRPRWTGQIRPFVDTAKPAISGVPRRELSFTSRRRVLARMCGPWCASCAART